MVTLRNLGKQNYPIQHLWEMHQGPGIKHQLTKQSNPLGSAKSNIKNYLKTIPNYFFSKMLSPLRGGSF